MQNLSPFSTSPVFSYGLFQNVLEQQKNGKHLKACSSDVVTVRNYHIVVTGWSACCSYPDNQNCSYIQTAFHSINVYNSPGVGGPPTLLHCSHKKSFSVGLPLGWFGKSNLQQILILDSLVRFRWPVLCLVDDV